MKKIVLFLLFSFLALSLAWAQDTKVITGTESGERVIESTKAVETESYTLESVGAVSITSGQTIRFGDGTTIKEGARFEGKTETVSADVDNTDNTDDFEAPHRQPVNTQPLNIQPFDPMAGIHGVLTPRPNNIGTVDLGYPMWVPEGIGGMTPAIGLTYSSSANKGNCGYGWNIGTSMIIIDTKFNTPKYDGNDSYLLDGSEMVRISENEYRLKMEGAFLRIIYDSNGNDFTVYSLDGSVSKYGTTSWSKISDPDDESRVFSWCLTETTDSYGNKISYQYEETTENGIKTNIYLKTISYGFVGGLPLYTVTLNWIEGDEARYNYKPLFLIKHDRLLDSVEVKSNITPTSEVLRSYDLVYTEGAFGVELLERVYEKSSDGSILNQMIFSYETDETITYGNEQEWAFGEAHQLFDFNGDGLLDRLTFPDSITESTGNEIEVAINNGSGFNPGDDWNTATLPGYVSCTQASHVIEDINGDGRADVTITSRQRTSQAGAGYSYNWFLVNMGDHFEAKEGDFNETMSRCPESEYEYKVPKYDRTDTSAIDINGDGAPDKVIREDNLPYDNTKVSVYINRGGEFQEKPDWSIIFEEPVFFQDVTGDGLLDAVTLDEYYPYSLSYQKNIGNGFETTKYLFLENHTGVANDSILLDVNGDATPDLVRQSYSTSRVWLGQKMNRHILQEVKNGITGVATTMEYEDIPMNDTLAIPQYNESTVLSSYTTGNEDLSFTTRVSYKTGIIDLYEHLFRGFSQVTTEMDDTAENVIHITDTYYNYQNVYEVDEFGNYKYDQYIVGKTNRVVTKYKEGGNGPVILSDSRSYFTSENVFNTVQDYEKEEVKFTYPHLVEERIYDDNGNYLGKTEASSSYDFDYDNGVLLKVTNTSSGDIANDLDDFVSTTYLASNITPAVWLQKPYLFETLWSYTNEYINKQKIYYNGLGLGDINQGEITEITIEKWNNNGENLSNTITLDGYGNLNSIIDESGLTSAVDITYQQSGDIAVVTATSPLGLSTTTYVNQYGEVREVHNQAGDVTSYFYDDYGRVMKVVGPDDNDTSPAVEVEYGVGTFFDAEYDQWGGSTSEQVKRFYAKARYKDDSDDGYYHAHYFKDELGRDGQNRFEAEVEGSHEWIIDAKVYYDSMGRVEKVGNITGVAYDQLDDIYYGENCYIIPDMYTYYEYDKLGRIKEVFLPGGKKKIDYIYDSFVDTYEPFATDVFSGTTSRILSKVRVGSFDLENLTYGFPTPINDETVYRDMYGRAVKTESRDGDTDPVYSYIDFNYSGLVRQKDHFGKITEAEYDTLGRLKYIKTPDAGKTAYNYNSAGRLSSVFEYGLDEIDYRTISYTYDNYGRISSVDYPDYENDIDYEYYGIGAEVGKYNRGQVYKITKGFHEYTWGSTTYSSKEFEQTMSYDWRTINITKNIDETDYFTSYEMDVQGRVKNITTPNGETLTYGYNSGGLLERVSGSKSIGGGIALDDSYIDSILYNRYGQRTYARYGNGAEMTYEYDPYTHLMDKYSVDKGDFNILEYNYTFSIAGGLTQISGSSANGASTFNQGYTYDMRNRLINSNGNFYAPNSANDSSYAREYVYDDMNRILKKTLTNGAFQDFSYEVDSHRINTVRNYNEFGQLTDRSLFGYDDYGNMIRKYKFQGMETTASQTTYYDYDQANKMVGFTQGGKRLEFSYDHAGQRTTKKVFDNSTLTTSAVYVNGFYTIKDGKAAVHVTDGREVVASKLVETPERKIYYHQNHLGSTALVTNSNGGKVQSFLYHPYGELWVVEKGPSVFSYDGDGEKIDTDVNKLFTGQIYDKETGLYYYNARYYDPELGMFLRPDPAMDGFNHYSYCKGNPVMFTDPTGLESESGDGTTNQSQAGQTDPSGATVAPTAAKSVEGSDGDTNGGKEGINGDSTSDSRMTHSWWGTQEGFDIQIKGIGNVDESTVERGKGNNSKDPIFCFTYKYSNGSGKDSGGDSGNSNSSANASKANASRAVPVKTTSAEGRSRTRVSSRGPGYSRSSYKFMPIGNDDYKEVLKDIGTDMLVEFCDQLDFIVPGQTKSIYDDVQNIISFSSVLCWKYADWIQYEYFWQIDSTEWNQELASYNYAWANWLRIYGFALIGEGDLESATEEYLKAVEIFADYLSDPEVIKEHRQGDSWQRSDFKYEDPI